MLAVPMVMSTAISSKDIRDTQQTASRSSEDPISIGMSMCPIWPAPVCWNYFSVNVIEV